MAREYARSRRVEQQVQRSLGELIMRGELKDPRAHGVTVTAVRMPGDLSVARVYFSLLDPDGDPAPAQEALEHAAGYLRSQLGRMLKLRHIPELRFEHDDSARRGSELSRLIDEARRRDAGDA